MGGYFMSMCKYFHEPKASENTNVRVKCRPILYDECNKLYILQNSKSSEVTPPYF